MEKNSLVIGKKGEQSYRGRTKKEVTSLREKRKRRLGLYRRLFGEVQMMEEPLYA